jgi:hypothetical protein
MSAELQTIGISAGVATNSRNADAAREVVTFLTSPAAGDHSKEWVRADNTLVISQSPR